MNLHNQPSGCVCSIIGQASWVMVAHINALHSISSETEVLVPHPSFGGSMKKPQDSQKFSSVQFPPRRYRCSYEDTDVFHHLCKGPHVRTTDMTYVFEIEPRILSN